MKVAAIWLISGAVAAQSAATVPSQYEQVPGNDAFSMPIRWHEGLMQVLLRNHKKDGGVVPAGMVGQSLKSVAVRRPAFLEEPPYGALTRTFTVRIATTDVVIGKFVSDMGANRTTVEAAKGATKLTAVVSAQRFNIAATTRQRRSDPVGSDLVRVPFAVPYTFPGNDLFLEWETTSGDTRPDENGWIDALVFAFTGDNGIAVTLGQGGCRGVLPRTGLPMTLESDGTTPTSGKTVTLRLRGALSSAPSFLFFGPRPFAKPSTSRLATYSPRALFLKNISRPGCRIWADRLLYTTAQTATTGEFEYKLAIPALDPKVIGSLFVFQAAVYDKKANLLDLSNGVAVMPGSAHVKDWAVTVLSPRTFELNAKKLKIPPTSPWKPFRSSLPILRFGW